MLNIRPMWSQFSQYIYYVLAKNKTVKKKCFMTREKAPHHTISDEYEAESGEPTLNKWPSIPRSDKSALLIEISLRFKLFVFLT